MITLKIIPILILNISATIYCKKKEIGLLRAIGAKRSTIFLIYLFESLIVAVLSTIIGGAGVLIFSNVFKISGIVHSISFGVVSFSIVQVLILFGTGLFIAVAGSFVPVLIITRKECGEVLK